MQENKHVFIFLKEQHAEEKCLFLERKNIEKDLLRHVQDALEDKHTEALVKEHTNLISDDIPSVLDYLFNNYVNVSSEEVTKKDLEVMSMAWLPYDTIVLLTAPLDHLKKLFQHAGITYIDKQILEKVLSLIRATKDFEYALAIWKNKKDGGKYWSNFKMHFHDSQLLLKTTRGLNMKQAGYHHPNSLASKISTDIKEQLN